MTTDQFITAVAEKAGITKAAAKIAINATFSTIKEEVKADGSIRINDFATFSKGYREARKGINPATKQPIDIPGKDTLKVKASINFF